MLFFFGLFETKLEYLEYILIIYIILVSNLKVKYINDTSEVGVTHLFLKFLD